MLCKAAEYGFEYVELGHSTPISAVDEIKRALDDGIVKVSSLHNFCPLPPYATGMAPNLFSPATNSKGESSLWYKNTINTLNFAKEVDASKIVAHTGAIHYFWFNPSYVLEKKFDELGYDKIAESLEYQNILKKYLKTSESKAQKHHRFILENLEKINEELKSRNIILGIENRDGLSELPFDTLYADFLYEVMAKCSNIMAWHDIGHSQIKELLGIIKIEEMLEKLEGRICGWHIHDCTSECKDHKGLGSGILDIGKFKKYFNPDSQVFVLELNGSVSSSDVKDSLKILQDSF